MAAIIASDREAEFSDKLALLTALRALRPQREQEFSAYFAQLQSKLSATRFTGTVEHVEEFISDARIAVLPERIGGGFKLKLLEYVFNRIPVLGLRGSVAGTPLRDDSSVLLFSNQTELARGVTRMIDNLGRLNQLQNAAYAACRNAFDWASRGKRLVTALESL